MFLKPTTSYIVEGEKIKIPKGCAELHHEVELGEVHFSCMRELGEVHYLRGLGEVHFSCVRASCGDGNGIVVQSNFGLRDFMEPIKIFSIE